MHIEDETRADGGELSLRAVTPGAGEGLPIAPGIVVPLSELQWRFSRSSGPGGQNVNKVETRVELLFNPGESAAFDPHTRQLLLDRLASRLDGNGNLSVLGAISRSQLRNREAAIERLKEILQGALRPRRRRVPTRVSEAQKRLRVAAKRQRSEVKRKRVYRDAE